MPTHAALRDELEQLVVLDLLGPKGGPEEEVADDRVRERYLVGVLDPLVLHDGPMAPWVVSPEYTEVRVHEQRHSPLDEGRTVTVIPDVVLTRDGMPVLALDAKYKMEEAQADVYQALAYCHALSLPEAVLVYPATGESLRSRLRIRGPGGVAVRYVPLAIGGDVQALRDRAAAFWAEIQAVALVAEPQA